MKQYYHYRNSGKPLKGARKPKRELETPEDIETLILYHQASKHLLWPNESVSEDEFYNFLLKRFRACIRNAPPVVSSFASKTYIDCVESIRERISRAKDDKELKEIIFTIQEEMRKRPYDYEVVFFKSFDPYKYKRSDLNATEKKESIEFFPYDNTCSIDTENSVLLKSHKDRELRYSLSKVDIDQIKRGQYLLSVDKKIIKVNATTDDYQKLLTERVSTQKARENLDSENYAFNNVLRESRVNFRKGRDITAEELIERFNLYGLEFGSWVSQTERRLFVNNLYDALADLCYILEIDPKCIGLNGTLGISFGARGRKFEAGHYEYSNRVLSLTRFKGVGSVAHEWFHALDFFLGEVFLNSLSKPISSRPEALDSLKELIKSMVSEKSEYFRISLLIDTVYETHYWANTTELLARAFNSYCIDSMKNQNSRNTFLAQERDFKYVPDKYDKELEGVSFFPHSKERETYNAYFREFFIELVEQDVFQKLDKSNNALFLNDPDSEITRQISFFDDDR